MSDNAHCRAAPRFDLTPAVAKIGIALGIGVCSIDVAVVELVGEVRRKYLDLFLLSAKKVQRFSAVYRGPIARAKTHKFENTRQQGTSIYASDAASVKLASRIKCFHFMRLDPSSCSELKNDDHGYGRRRLHRFTYLRRVDH